MHLGSGTRLQISHPLQCRCGLRSKQIESIKPSGEEHNNEESEYSEKAEKEERQSPTAGRRKPGKENRTRRAPSCGETRTIPDALCSCGYSHFRNIANGQPPFIIWTLEGKFPPSQNCGCPKPAVAATNDCGNSCKQFSKPDRSDPVEPPADPPYIDNESPVLFYH